MKLFTQRTPAAPPDGKTANCNSQPPNAMTDTTTPEQQLQTPATEPATPLSYAAGLQRLIERAAHDGFCDFAAWFDGERSLTNGKPCNCGRAADIALATVLAAELEQLEAAVAAATVGDAPFAFLASHPTLVRPIVVAAASLAAGFSLPSHPHAAEERA